MTHQQQTAFKNIVGKGEIARNEQFLLFPQCFLLNQIIVSLIANIFDNMSLFAAELEQLKIDISDKGLKRFSGAGINFENIIDPPIWHEYWFGFKDVESRESI